jgi:hypothetical protein
MQLIIAQSQPPDAPIAMPSRQVLAEGVDEVVEDLGGDKVG